MPSGAIASMLPVPEIGTFLSTQYGLSIIIEHRNYTLAQKAELYQTIAEERHVIYGYATEVQLEKPAYTAEGFSQKLTSDNLGLWTNMYLAAQCLRYKVTGEEEAWQAANNTFWGLNRLYKVVPPVNYGLMAKAAILNGTLPKGPLWHQCTNPGYTDWIYKAGTSSDDVTSYYYAIPLYIEYVARTDEERNTALDMLINTIDYIMENNYFLINTDGRPTNWGFWNPQRLNDNPQYYSERLSNSIEIMAYLAVAYHYTREQKYLGALYELGVQNQYLENIVNSRSNCPIDENFSDDELNYLALSAFFFVKDSVPELFREYFTQNIKHTWAQVQKYQPSLWTYMTYVALRDDEKLSEIVTHEHLDLSELELQQWANLIDFFVDNNHRIDIVLNKLPQRNDKTDPQSVDVIRRDETSAGGQWNSNPYRLNSYSSAQLEKNPAFFLLPYWYKRYIEEYMAQ